MAANEANLLFKLGGDSSSFIKAMQAASSALSAVTPVISGQMAQIAASLSQSLASPSASFASQIDNLKTSLAELGGPSSSLITTANTIKVLGQDLSDLGSKLKLFSLASESALVSDKELNENVFKLTTSFSNLNAALPKTFAAEQQVAGAFIKQANDAQELSLILSNLQKAYTVLSGVVKQAGDAIAEQKAKEAQEFKEAADKEKALVAETLLNVKTAKKKESDAAKEAANDFKTAATKAAQAEKQDKVNAINSVIQKVKEESGVIISSSSATKLLESQSLSTFGKIKTAIAVAAIETRGLNRGLQQIAGGLQAAGNSLRFFGLSVTGAFAGALTAANSYITEIRTLSAETGKSFEESQKLVGLFATVGITGQEAAKTIRFLSDNLLKAEEGSKGAVEKFQRLGISTADLHAVGNDTVKVFELIADRIQSIQDPAKRAAAVSELLGSSLGNAAKFLPLLTQGSEGLRKTLGEVTGLSEQQLVAIEELNKEWNNFKLSLVQFSATAISDIKPTVEAIITTVEKFLRVVENHPKITTFALAVTGLAGAAALIGGPFLIAAASAIKVAEAFQTGGLAATLFGTVFGGLPAKIAAVTTSLLTLNGVLTGGIVLGVVGLGAALLGIYEANKKTQESTQAWQEEIRSADATLTKYKDTVNKFGSDFYKQSNAITVTRDALKAVNLEIVATNSNESLSIAQKAKIINALLEERKGILETSNAAKEYQQSLMGVVQSTDDVVKSALKAARATEDLIKAQRSTSDLSFEQQRNVLTEKYSNLILDQKRLISEGSKSKIDGDKEIAKLEDELAAKTFDLEKQRSSSFSQTTESEIAAEQNKLDILIKAEADYQTQVNTLKKQGDDQAAQQAQSKLETTQSQVEESQARIRDLKNQEVRESIQADKVIADSYISARKKEIEAQQEKHNQELKLNEQAIKQRESLAEKEARISEKSISEAARSKETEFEEKRNLLEDEFALKEEQIKRQVIQGTLTEVEAQKKLNDLKEQEISQETEIAKQERDIKIAIAEQSIELEKQLQQKLLNVKQDYQEQFDKAQAHGLDEQAAHFKQLIDETDVKLQESVNKIGDYKNQEKEATLKANREIRKDDTERFKLQTQDLKNYQDLLNQVLGETSGRGKGGGLAGLGAGGGSPFLPITNAISQFSKSFENISAKIALGNLGFSASALSPLTTSASLSSLTSETIVGSKFKDIFGPKASSSSGANVTTINIDGSAISLSRKAQEHVSGLIDALQDMNYAGFAGGNS